ncbi:uncharacterized protein LOC144864755 [Branchiostoma floridae x Branchiostoma japonicum]
MSKCGGMTQLGDVATITSPDIIGPCTLEFWYTMYGVDLDMSVYLLQKGQKTQVWHKADVNDDFWQRANVQLSPPVQEAYQVVFESMRGTNFLCNVAFDDVKLAPAPLLKCDFETTGPCALRQDVSDAFDWRWQQGLTETREDIFNRNLTNLAPNLITGPEYDVTLGPGGNGTYMYVESSLQAAGHHARLSSTELSGQCLEFYFHMLGAHAGTLKVYQKSVSQNSSAEQLIWEVSGSHGDVWHRAAVNLNITNNFYLSFEAVVGGYYSNIAIDEVRTMAQPCNSTIAVTTTQTTTTETTTETTTMEETTMEETTMAETTMAETTMAETTMAETTTLETTTTMELTTVEATTAGVTPGHYKTTKEATKAITDKPTKIVSTLKPGLLESESAPVCTNEYMELALPAHRLSHVVTSGLHWDPDPSCQATFNGTHYILRTGLYQCGTKVTFDSKYVIFYNNVSLLFTHDGVITRDPDVVIHSVCKYDRDEAVMSEFLPIPGGLEFVDEGFGQLSIRLDLFPTQSYLSPYTTPDYPVHLHLRDMMYLQLQVQGHARQLSVIALHCQATSGNNASLKYPLIQDGCASDDTLQFYAHPEPGTQRFGLEAFRFVQEVTTVNIRCEVEVCDAADTTSRCEQGCRTNRHHKRALGDQDAMKSRYVISQGPIIFSADFQEADGAKAAVIAVGGSAVVIVLAAVLLAVRVRRSKRVHPGYQPLSNLDAE